MGICGPAFFMCVLICWRESPFNNEKLVLEKSESPLILFYFKRKNKTKKKTLKKLLHGFGKASLGKPESWSGDQVTYWEGTSKR